MGRSLLGVVVKVLDCDIVVSEFEFQSYYKFFELIPLRKV